MLSRIMIFYLLQSLGVGWRTVTRLRPLLANYSIFRYASCL